MSDPLALDPAEMPDRTSTRQGLMQPAQNLYQTAFHGNAPNELGRIYQGARTAQFLQAEGSEYPEQQSNA